MNIDLNPPSFMAINGTNYLILEKRVMSPQEPIQCEWDVMDNDKAKSTVRVYSSGTVVRIYKVGDRTEVEPCSPVLSAYDQ